MLKFLLEIILALSLLFGCNAKSEPVLILEKTFGFSAEENAITHFEDSHGGFHGDGETLIIFSPTEEQVQKIKTHWKKSPVDSQLIPLLFCDTEYNVSDETLSTAEGYWYFNDRSPAAVSYLSNFTFAFFDGESCWYYELDT